MFCCVVRIGVWVYVVERRLHSFCKARTYSIHATKSFLHFFVTIAIGFLLARYAVVVAAVVVVVFVVVATAATALCC